MKFDVITYKQKMDVNLSFLKEGHLFLFPAKTGKERFMRVNCGTHHNVVNLTTGKSEFLHGGATVRVLEPQVIDDTWIKRKVARIFFSGFVTAIVALGICGLAFALIV